MQRDRICAERSNSRYVCTMYRFFRWKVKPARRNLSVVTHHRPTCACRSNGSELMGTVTLHIDALHSGDGSFVKNDLAKHSTSPDCLLPQMQTYQLAKEGPLSVFTIWSRTPWFGRFPDLSSKAIPNTSRPGTAFRFSHFWKVMFKNMRFESSTNISSLS